MKKYDQKLLESVPPDYYDKGIKINLLQKIWHGWKWRTLQILIADLHGNILDVGCAGGMLTQKIKDHLPEANLTGVDLYDNAIKYAQKKHPSIRFMRADAHYLPFEKNSFDVVIAVETLEHLHDPQKAVEEIFRVLKPNGTFIVGQDTDNLGCRIGWWFWTKMQGKVWHGVHVSCMAPQELKKLLIDNGFRINKCKFSHFGLEVFLKSVKKGKK